MRAYRVIGCAVALASASSAFAIDIVLVPSASLSANPAALAAFNRAAAQWESRLSDPITITINADFAPIGFPTAQTSSAVILRTYNNVRNLMVADALTYLNRHRVYEFAAAHRLPAIYEVEQFVRDGGLMSYGPDPKEITERAAYVIDRIFKGAAPADLPLEEPTRFRLVVNLKAAAAIGLTLSPALLAEADQVFE